MADYSSEAVTHAGTTPTSRSAAAGDKLTTPATGKFLRVTNGGGASITLTINPPGDTSYGVANPDKVITIANGVTKYIAVLPVYGDPADGGKVSLAWSATTSVTFEYLQAA